MTMNRQPQQGHQDIISANDLLAKMRAGVKESYEIRLRELIIPVRVLSLDEINEIRRTVKTDMARLAGADEADSSVKMQRYVLKLASNVNNTAPLLGDKLLSMLTIDELNHLYNEYMKVIDDVNPSLETISPEEFRRLVDAVKKNYVTSRDLSLLHLRAIFTAYQALIQRPENPDSPPAN